MSVRLVATIVTFGVAMALLAGRASAQDANETTNTSEQSPIEATEQPAPSLESATDETVADAAAPDLEDPSRGLREATAPPAAEIGNPPSARLAQPQAEPVVYAYVTPPTSSPNTCSPRPRPCVRITGLAGLTYYVINKDRFRSWATQNYNAPYDVDRAIRRMLSADIGQQHMPMEGRQVLQLDIPNEPYYVIPWCARDIDDQEVWRASWQTRREIIMRSEEIEEVVAQCQ